VKPWIIRRNILGVSNTLLIEWTHEDRDLYKIIEGCCNDLAIGRQWAKPGAQNLKNWGSCVQRAPKMGKSPRSKIFILGAITRYGMAPKIGNSTGVKIEFGAPGLSPNQNSKPKWAKTPE
jgi:hypothetical protein